MYYILRVPVRWAVMQATAWFVVLAAFAANTLALDNGVGRTPIMGWTSASSPHPTLPEQRCRRPVWLMLPHVSEWRWMMERNDSPWYPSMRIFRQTSRGDWKDVIEAMREDLANWAAN